MSLQVFSYQNNPIAFSQKDSVMINANQMAKPFGKLVSNFTKTEQTQYFIDALCKQYSLKNSEVLLSVNGGSNPGTWMHQKLAIKFAAWLSPEFELWVYDRVEELLLTGKTEIRHKSPAEIIEEGYKLALQEVTLYKEQLQLANSTIKEQAPKVEYFEKVIDSKSLIPSSVIADHFGESAQWLHKELKTRGVVWKVGGVWVLTAKYKDKGYAEIKPFPYYDTLGNLKTKNQTYWTEKGRMFIHNLLPESKAA
ncbi:hypothetical protein AHMF7605_12020 [Adhaeribacter arboris]|uniref:KilA-N domain-containing protein n=1 Tax=Adhaeribacter arboris TaxID=2072846 RepID=A0A2T2YFB0_9BACT|nr:phage antirepressor KilAC domain-containing protein [Adhaeribacter arboris]PSR54197.1 hypothetical protein AHMF7605_12020 [Adhaeribacter arboris]